MIENGASLEASWDLVYRTFSSVYLGALPGPGFTAPPTCEPDIYLKYFLIYGKDVKKGLP